MTNSSRPAVCWSMSRARVCSADDYDVVYPAQYDREKDVDLAEKFRASGDELLIDQLVRCRRCSFQYVNPRLPGEAILTGYTEGDDPTYVSQLKARERTFAASLRGDRARGGRQGAAARHRHGRGRVRRRPRATEGWQAEGCEPNRWLAQWGADHYGITIRQGIAVRSAL